MRPNNSFKRTPRFMATHKVLRSIAHNAAHSLRSDMWWVADLLFYEHPGRHCSPATVATTPFRDALQHMPQALDHWVESGGAATEMVQSARMSSITTSSTNDSPGRRRPYYQ